MAVPHFFPFLPPSPSFPVERERCAIPSPKSCWSETLCEFLRLDLLGGMTYLLGKGIFEKWKKDGEEKRKE